MQQSQDRASETRQYDQVEVRRTFRLLSMDVMCYLCGLAFIDTSTILPAFLSTLTGNPTVIGAIIAIRSAGIFLPQLWTAHYLRERKRHKGFLMKDAAVSRIAVTVLGLVLLIAGPRDKTLMLVVFILTYTAFWFSEGVAGVPWTDLVAKTIPERLRGRLFGFTQFGGGILALFAGLFISRMMAPNGPGYPINYGILMIVAAFFFWASFFFLLAVHEPDGEPEEHDGGFLDYVRNISKMLAGHKQLKRMLAIQLLIGFSGMSLPFYILYAREVSGISGAMVGTLLSVQVAGSIILSAATGFLSDRYGPRWAITASVASGVLAPVIILLGDGGIWTYGLVFFTLGGLNGSAWIGLTNYLLESVEPAERRSSIGIMNTANAPTMVFPIIGGLIVQVASYRAAFTITAVALAVALVLAFCLPAKRQATG